MIDEEYESPIEWDDEDMTSLEQVKRRVTNLRRIVDEGLLEDFSEDEWKLLMRDGLHAVEYNPKRSWEETVNVMEFFKSQGALLDDSVGSEAEKMLELFREHYTPERKKQCDFMYRKMTWLFENGAEANVHDENNRAMNFFTLNNEAFLDDMFSERDSKYLRTMWKKTAELLEEHSGQISEKTFEMVCDSINDTTQSPLEMARIDNPAKDAHILGTKEIWVYGKDTSFPMPHFHCIDRKNIPNFELEVKIEDLTICRISSHGSKSHYYPSYSWESFLDAKEVLETWLWRANADAPTMTNYQMIKVAWNQNNRDNQIKM